MRQEGEASVEEILDSIKKVIARDNRATASVERKRRETAGVTESEEQSDTDEILDLVAADIVEEIEAVRMDDRLHEDEALETEDGDEPLIDDQARDAMRENLAALAMLAKPGVPPQIVRSGETSLEGMVREMLRPMLAEWLDRNLPGMVEAMVRKEIARIAGKKG